eukprot:CAMPEP_0174705040 /NCGR_PEP_ID=MMETSP1094-20130205/8412_1 /TAXON_ID=156173 /ORGANISM="Chrysochromulina brevifilum, Strain UTEX LB 985" /LENGTH=224 /DNA_ID=CAMNT_0015903159 /DNA_START=392 /DNA_END=1066 /DNA_ORIENTATION=+
MEAIAEAIVVSPNVILSLSVWLGGASLLIARPALPGAHATPRTKAMPLAVTTALGVAAATGIDSTIGEGLVGGSGVGAGDLLRRRGVRGGVAAGVGGEVEHADLAAGQRAVPGEDEAARRKRVEESRRALLRGGLGASQVAEGTASPRKLLPCMGQVLVSNEMPRVKLLLDRLSPAYQSTAEDDKQDACCHHPQVKRGDELTLLVNDQSTDDGGRGDGAVFDRE